MAKQSDLLKSALSKRPNANRTGPVDDPELRKMAPTLHEFLTVPIKEGDREEQTGTLLVFVEEGSWKGCLNARGAGLTLWATSDSAWGVIDALEAALTAEIVPWRTAPVWKPKGRPR